MSKNNTYDYCNENGRDYDIDNNSKTNKNIDSNKDNEPQKDIDNNNNKNNICIETMIINIMIAFLIKKRTYNDIHRLDQYLEERVTAITDELL